jgi:REP element-mobilizing transposase RayT
MARHLRIEFPGAVYHVTSRGNERRPIVRDDEDREMFVQILGRVVLKFGLALYAWVLLDNHWHIFCRTPEPNLSRAMKMLNQLYAEYFNRRHRRVGHLFQGRYKAFLVDSDTYFREVARYVVLNPVRAGMCEAAGGYKWSSYRATAGLEDVPEWLAADDLLDVFDCFDRANARELYRELVAAGKTDDDLMDRITSQLVLGSEAYIARVRELIDDKRQADREYTREQRFVGRPTIDAVVRAVATHCQVEPRVIHTGHGGLARMMTAGLAVDVGLARLSPVARTLGLRSPSRVSTLASRCRTEVDSTPELRALRDRILADIYPQVTHPLVERPPTPAPDDAPF